MTEKQRSLTLRQERFVMEYMASGNAAGAARIVGYKQPKVQGCRLLTKDNVKQAIQGHREHVMDDLQGKVARYVAALERESQSEDNSDSSRIRSLELLLKVAGGFAPEKTETTTFSGGFLADLDLNEPDSTAVEALKASEISDLH